MLESPNRPRFKLLVFETPAVGDTHIRARTAVLKRVESADRSHDFIQSKFPQLSHDVSSGDHNSFR